MDPASRNIILRNRANLSRSIDLVKLKRFLEKSEIFTRAMLRDIYESPTDYDFYVELTTRGPDALDKFRQVLRDAGYSKEARILETNSLNFRDPDAVDKLHPILKKAEGNIFETNSSTSVSTEDTRKKRCYKMNSTPYVGYCFIINNVNFRRHSERIGSDVDAEALDKLFQKLAFKVKRERNLEAAQMLKYLKKFSEKDWSKVDSCVIIILSHGDNSRNLDIVFGSDSEYVKLIEIYKIFDNEDCELLQSKPKMFFISACRGDKQDFGVWTNVSSDAASIKKISTMSDMLVVHSSLPNHKSYRDHYLGTWFCQDLIEVFTSDYLIHDVQTMLKTVGLKLELRLEDYMTKQVLHTEDFGLKADIFLSMEKVPDNYEIYDPRRSLP